jgi:hypothetical protein
MSEDSVDYLRASERRSRKGSPWLGVGLVISLGLNTYLFLRTVHQSREMAGMERHLQSEIIRLSEDSSAAFERDQKRFYEMKQALETAAIKRPYISPPDGVLAQPEVERGHSLQARTIERSQPGEASQGEAKHYSDAKLRDTGTTIQNTGPHAQGSSASLDGVNSKAIMPAAKPATTNALTEVEQVSTPLENVALDSKRTDGAALNSATATKPAAPRAVGEHNERNSFDIDLVKDKTGQTFGDIRIALKKCDLKHNRFTLTIFAGDKAVEKKDQAVNEPVQVYVAVSSQPYEIVITQVKRDEVIGSLAVPKAKTRPNASAKTASLGSHEPARPNP